jgi:hypothetical protein
VALLVASVLIALALGLPDRGRLLVNFRDGIALWLEWGSSVLDLPSGAPSLFRGSLRDAWLKAAAWGVSFGVVWLALRGLTPRVASADQRLSWAAPWCLAVGVMAALSVSWAIEGRSPLTPDTGSVAIVRARWLAHAAYDFRSHRLLAPADALAALRMRTSSRRPASREPAPLLAIHHLPAGTYRLRAVDAKEASGTLSLRVGESFPLPLSTWKIDNGAAGHDVRLPVALRSLVVDGDADALQSISAVELEVTAAASPSPVRGAAVRAVRYGSSHVYFMDENAFPEPHGVWVAGGRTAQFVISTESAPRQLFIRNSPVANRVNLEVDGVRREVVLAPREETVIPLPVGPAGDAVLVVQSPRGFRPSQEDPANGDMRYLGCWLELR